MSLLDPSEYPEVLPVLSPPRRRGHPVLAWLVIAVLVAVNFYLQRERTESTGRSEKQALLTVRTQARYLVGGQELFRQSQQQGRGPAEQAAALDTGGADQRLRYVVLVGELSGPEKALQQLGQFNAWAATRKEPLSSEQTKIRDVLVLLYSDYAAKKWDAPSLTAEQRAFLRDKLDWFGGLALAPADGPDTAARAKLLKEAYLTTGTTIGTFLLFAVLGVGGATGLLFLLVSFARGRLWPSFRTGLPNDGIYAETFAVWMVLFLALSYAVNQRTPPEYRLPAVIGVMLGSLAALAWPILRGIPWRQVRHDVGLTVGQRPGRELLCGMATYTMALPMLLVGLLLVGVLMRLLHYLQGHGVPVDRLAENPSHPIVEMLFQADGWGRLQIFLMACVAAPLVEETMFRGVLYRHLREASAGTRALLSALLSATVVSFVFAVVHPQGLLGVPVLMALAYAFALAREWRDTLLPAMVAHGINNGAVFVLALLLAS